jgi:DMSO reductase anchor subunit
MILIVSAAIYGAWLGLSMKPGIRSVMLAAFSVGVTQYAAICLSYELLNRAGSADLAVAMQSYAGTQTRDVIPTAMAAAFGSALVGSITAILHLGEKRRRVRVAAFED